jgi:hypothetical protein
MWMANIYVSNLWYRTPSRKGKARAKGEARAAFRAIPRLQNRGGAKAPEASGAYLMDVQDDFSDSAR